MKTTRNQLIIYVATLISFLILLISYFTEYRNIEITTDQTNDLVVQKIMNHLGRFQSALAEIETYETPFLISSNKSTNSNFELPYQTANKELDSLKLFCDNEIFLCNDILQLDSLFKKKLALNNNPVVLSESGKPDSLMVLLQLEKNKLLRSALFHTYENISVRAWANVTFSREKKETNSKLLYQLLGLSIAVPLVLLIFILWRFLVQSSIKEKLLDKTKVYERVRDGFIATDINYNINYFNSSIDEIFALKGKNIYGLNIFDLLNEFGSKINDTLIVDCFTKQVSKAFSILNQQTGRYYLINIFPSLNGLSFHIKDVSLVKKADDEIHKSKRVYEFISSTNDLILHAKSTHEIFTEICNIAVKSGNFLFAWIGEPDIATHTIRPIKWSGKEDGFLNVLNISTENILNGKCPTGRAFREGRYCCSNDISNDPTMFIWSEAALKRGYQSVIALPVIVDKKVTNVITLYAPQKFFFTEEEVKLLARVTDNISYALNNIYIDKLRSDAEKQLQKVTQAVEQSSASVVITDIKGVIEYVNPAFTKLTGYTYAEAIGKTPRILKTDYTPLTIHEQLWNNLINFKEWEGTFCNRKKNGEIYWEYAVISPILNKNGEISNFVAVKENITERRRLEEAEKQLVKIIENTTSFVATADLNRNFLYANQALKNILEISEDEDIHQLKLYEFTFNGNLIIDEINDTLDKSGRWIGENILKSRSGKKIPVLQVIVIHKNEHGEPTHSSTTAIDLSAQKEKENEILKLNNELRQLSFHLQNIAEKERAEIAKEIHDELAQNLVALSMNASWLKGCIKDKSREIEELIDEQISIADLVIKTSRTLFNSLHPSMLDELGLEAAIKWHAKNFLKLSNIEVNIHANIDETNFSKEINLGLFRIFQESLTNIARHSKATKVIISIFKRNGSISLSIEDDGIGFDVTNVNVMSSHGLLGIRERVYAMMGKMLIESNPGKGTKLEVEIPLNEELLNEQSDYEIVI